MNQRIWTNGEIATRARSWDFMSILGALPDPDEVLRTQGSDQRIYRRLLFDAHVWAVVQSRQAGVLSMEWQLDRGLCKSRPAKILEDMLKRLDVRRMASEILGCILWGFQPLEVIWDDQGGWILPVRVVGKPAEWFAFDASNQLILRTRDDPQGSPVPDRKFLVAQHYATYTNPYGERALSRCFWPVTFKTAGWKYWIQFAEKYGQPWAIGKHDPMASDADVSRLLDMLDRMVRDAVAAIPSTASIELVTAGGGAGGSAEQFDRLIQAADREISKAILGHGAGADSTPGKLGNENGQMNVRADLIESDRKTVEATIQTLIRWVCEVNWGIGDVPQFSLCEEEDVRRPKADRDEVIARAAPHMRFTRIYLQKNYGYEDEDLEEAPIPPAPAALPQTAFAESSPSLVPPERMIADDLAGAGAHEAVQIVGEWVQALQALMARCSSLEQLKDRLADLYPDLPVDKLTELLAQANFGAHVAGRAYSERRVQRIRRQ